MDATKSRAKRSRSAYNDENADANVMPDDDARAEQSEELIGAFADIRKQWEQAMGAFRKESVEQQDATRVKYEDELRTLRERPTIPDGHELISSSELARDRKKLRKLPQLSEQVVALEEELGYTREKLEREKQARHKANETMRKQNAQIEAIRSLLNHRQRRSLGGLLTEQPQMSAYEDDDDDEYERDSSLLDASRSSAMSTPETAARGGILKQTPSRSAYASGNNTSTLSCDSQETASSANSSFADTGGAEYDNSEYTCGRRAADEDTDKGTFSNRRSVHENQYMEINGSEMRGFASQGAHPSAPSPPEHARDTDGHDSDDCCAPGGNASRAPHFKPASPPRAAVAASSKMTPGRSGKKTPKKGAQEPAANARMRRHFFKESKDNSRHRCQHCNDYISFRTKHIQCTQCQRHFHEGCQLKISADCRPPSFSGKAAQSRTAPPLGSNLQGTLASQSEAEMQGDPNVPGIVLDCIATIDRRGLNQKGIYRVSGNAAKVKILMDKYLMHTSVSKARPGHRKPNFQIVIDIHEVSGVLKRFLMDLDEPLTTYTEYKAFTFIARNSELRSEERNRQLCEVLCRMPTTYFYTLRTIIEHMQRVANNVADNHMDLNDLAAVLAPTLFRSPEGAFGDQKDSQLQIKALKNILKLPEEYWNTAEKDVCRHGVATNASPIPQKKELKRQKLSSKALKMMDQGSSK